MTPKRLAALAGVFLIALLITRASAEGPLQLDLRLELRHADDSDGACTAGRTAEVFWNTMRGDQPVADVRIDGVPQEGESGVALVRCPALPSDWRTWAARYGMPESRYEVLGTALAADGAKASAWLSLRVRPPLPTPADVSAFSLPHSGVLEIAFRDDGRDDERIVARWREEDGNEWRIGPPARRKIIDGTDGRRRATTAAWLDEGGYELQLARIYDDEKIGSLGETDWSETAALRVSNDLLQVTAEASHDSITVRLPDGVAAADLKLQLIGWPRRADGSAVDETHAWSRSLRAADSASSSSVRWHYLLPDSEYHLYWSWPHERGDEARYLLTARTAPAPPRYEPMLAETDGKTVEVGPRSVSLRWDSPPHARHPYRIAAYDYGTSTAISKLAVEAGPSHDVTLDGLRPGAAYRIEAIRWRPDGMAFGTSFIIETPEDQGSAPILNDRPAAPSVSHRELYPNYPVFRVMHISASVADAERWTELEYEWRNGGRTMRRLPTHGWFGLEQLPGTYEFRVRGRRDGRWSGWSEAVNLAVPPHTPVAIRARRVAAGLRVTWNDYNFELPDGYVVRWWIDDGPRNEIRGISERSVVLPIAADATGDLSVSVEADDSVLGESTGWAPFTRRLGRPPSAGVWWSESPCAPLPGFVHRIWLYVYEFAAPYKVTIGGRERPGAGDREYDLTIGCDELNADGELEWEVRDALGATISGSHRPAAIEIADAAAPALPAMQLLRVRTFDRNGMVAIWDCLNINAEDDYLVRWREIGRGEWQYQLYRYQPNMISMQWHGHQRIAWRHRDCPQEIGDLRPGAAYEVGVADVGQGPGMPHPDVLRWSETWAVTVPAEIEGVWVSREEAGTRVSWLSQPGVRRYVVVLRGEGRSWSRVHYSTGSERESALFDVPLAAGAYSAEVLTPDGAEGGPVALSAS